jgi:hypothetical protein
MSIPPGYLELYNHAGPAIRYRLLRDIIGEDESYIRTAHHALDLRKLPEVQKILSEQNEDGSWKDGPTTVTNYLRLCELGLESCEAIERCTENHVFPALLKAPDPQVRDVALRMITRSQKNPDPLIKSLLEQLLIEWDHFLSTDARHQAHHAAPSMDGYCALCFFPWSDDELPRVQEIVSRLFAYAEKTMDKPVVNPAFYLHSKEDYVRYPQQILYELEMSARLGVTQEIAATRWMYDEVEASQDADGWFRFEFDPLPDLAWYFPLEPEQNPEVDFTFRAMHILKLLEYDI